ncbi:hypothetical protein M5689_009015 [Euphorbia peplus]|nr:hypothetical protein M5689_009015 [Euphorbia peplus]
MTIKLSFVSFISLCSTIYCDDGYDPNPIVVDPHDYLLLSLVWQPSYCSDSMRYNHRMITGCIGREEFSFDEVRALFV